MQKENRKIFVVIVIAVLVLSLIGALGLLFFNKKESPTQVVSDIPENIEEIEKIEKRDLIFKEMGRENNRNTMVFVDDEGNSIVLYDFAESGASQGCAASNMKYNIVYYVGQDGLNHFYSCSQDTFIDQTTISTGNKDLDELADAITRTLNNNPPVFSDDGKPYVNEIATEIGEEDVSSNDILHIFSGDMNNFIELFVVDTNGQNNKEQLLSCFKKMEELYINEIDRAIIDINGYVGVLATKNDTTTAELLDVISGWANN